MEHKPCEQQEPCFLLVDIRGVKHLMSTYPTHEEVVELTGSPVGSFVFYDLQLSPTVLRIDMLLARTSRTILPETSYLDHLTFIAELQQQHPSDDAPWTVHEICRAADLHPFWVVELFQWQSGRAVPQITVLDFLQEEVEEGEEKKE